MAVAWLVYEHSYEPCNTNGGDISRLIFDTSVNIANTATVAETLINTGTYINPNDTWFSYVHS